MLPSGTLLLAQTEVADRPPTPPPPANAPVLTAPPAGAPALESTAIPGSPAQPGTPGTPGTLQPGQPLPPPRPQSTGWESLMTFLPIIAILVLFWFMMVSGQRKEKKKREQLLNSIKKGDKVQTVGGIVGTVVELRERDVILKVDENSNTRIKFVREAIQAVVQEKSE